ncbi:amidase family protein [Ruegeria hyattellae]|uniref:amidase family protein n=1 Tax=Ruegeria hyattellae TaxID=3233337 RepID=UPI00355BC341
MRNIDARAVTGSRNKSDVRHSQTKGPLSSCLANEIRVDLWDEAKSFREFNENFKTQLWKMTAAELTDHVRKRRVSATEVTEAHLQRLADVNPRINAVVQEFPEEAMQEARRVDGTITRGEDPGPPCGVPFTIKENVDRTGHVTSNGVRLLKDNLAQTDSPVVANVRKADGIIVGRTNTPAFLLR